MAPREVVARATGAKGEVLRLPKSLGFDILLEPAGGVDRSPADRALYSSTFELQLRQEVELMKMTYEIRAMKLSTGLTPARRQSDSDYQPYPYPHHVPLHLRCRCGHLCYCRRSGFRPLLCA
jgi:hypothetical protein